MTNAGKSFFRAVWLLGCLLLGAAVTAQEAGGPPLSRVKLSPKLYLPEKSLTRVVDEGEILSAEQEGRLVSLLAEASEQANLDFYIITVPATPPVPENEFFAEVLRGYSTGRWLMGVCFFASDTSQVPVFRVGGPGELTVGRPVLARAAALASQRAKSEMTPGAKVEAGVTEFILQARKAISAAVPDMAAKQAASTQLPPDVKPATAAGEAGPLAQTSWVTRIGLPTLFLSVLGALGLVGLLGWLFRGRSEITFPASTPRYRLQAPYSGGNNARVDFRPRARAQ